MKNIIDAIQITDDITKNTDQWPDWMLKAKDDGKIVLKIDEYKNTRTVCIVLDQYGGLMPIKQNHYLMHGMNSGLAVMEEAMLECNAVKFEKECPSGCKYYPITKDFMKSIHYWPDWVRKAYDDVIIYREFEHNLTGSFKLFCDNSNSEGSTQGKVELTEGLWLIRYPAGRVEVIDSNLAVALINQI